METTEQPAYEVRAIATWHLERIVFQLWVDDTNKKFCVYIGVLNEGENINTYRPMWQQGKGEFLPAERRAKAFYAEGESFFGDFIREMDDDATYEWDYR